MFKPNGGFAQKVGWLWMGGGDWRQLVVRQAACAPVGWFWLECRCGGEGWVGSQVAVGVHEGGCVQKDPA